MRDFLSTGDNHMVQARLAQAVLAEVPGQLTQYMRLHGIKPRPLPDINRLTVNSQPSAPPV